MKKEEPIEFSEYAQVESTGGWLAFMYCTVCGTAIFCFRNDNSPLELHRKWHNLPTTKKKTK